MTGPTKISECFKNYCDNKKFTILYYSRVPNKQWGGGGGGGGQTTLESLPRLGLILSRNFRFKFDIAWFVFRSLAQKVVLNLVHIYVVV